MAGHHGTCHTDLPTQNGSEVDLRYRQPTFLRPVLCNEGLYTPTVMSPQSDRWGPYLENIIHSLCLCVVYARVWGVPLTCECSRRGQRPTSDTFLCCSLLYFSETGSDLAGLAGQRTPTTYPFGAGDDGFYMGSRDWKVNPHVGATSTEPPSQPQENIIAQGGRLLTWDYKAVEGRAARTKVLSKGDAFVSCPL